MLASLLWYSQGVIMARPKLKLVLNSEECQALERLVRRRKTARHLTVRARIVLACGG